MLACNSQVSVNTVQGTGTGFSPKLDLDIRQVRTISMPQDLDNFLFYEEEKLTTMWKNCWSSERA